MNRKRKNLANKIILLAAVLLISMSAMGVGYAMWVDTIIVDGQIQMGEWYSDLEPGVCGTLNVSYVDPETVNINLLNPTKETYYSGCFYIVNDGSVPVKIDTITFNYNTGNFAVGPEVDVAVDDVIYGGESILCTVSLTTDDTQTQQDIDFDVVIETVLFNE